MKRNLKKICGRCNSEFTCGLHGCWCGDLVISKEQYAIIEDRYHDCLCPACLRQISEGKVDLTQEPHESAS